MRSHLSTIVPRMIKAGLRVRECRYRVIAAGLDSRGRVISIATNTPRLPNRGMHAEERIMHSTPKLLNRILLLRVGAKGQILPTDPYLHCQKLSDKRGVSIERIGGVR